MSEQDSKASVIAARKAALQASDRYVAGEAKAAEAQQSRTLAAANATAQAVEAGWIATLDKADKAKIDAVLTEHGWNGEGNPDAKVRQAARDDIRKAVATMAAIDQTTWGLVNGVGKTMVSQWITMGRAVSIPGVDPESNPALWTELTSGAMAQVPAVKAAVKAEDATAATVKAAVDKAKADAEAVKRAAKAKREAKAGIGTVSGDTPKARVDSALGLLRQALSDVDDATVRGLTRRVEAMVAEVIAERKTSAA